MNPCNSTKMKRIGKLYLVIVLDKCPNDGKIHFIVSACDILVKACSRHGFHNTPKRVSDGAREVAYDFQDIIWKFHRRVNEVYNIKVDSIFTEGRQNLF